VNEKDGSVMVLITDAKGQPVRFRNKDSRKEEIVYIDVLETTAAQYVKYLNEEGNREDGGVSYLKLDPKFTDIRKEGPGRFAVKPDGKNRAVINVNWFGARAYCAWAGKALPREEEWAAAARPRAAGPYVWGKRRPVFGEDCHGARTYNAVGGSVAKDVSAARCFDLAGNVAEWCDDYYDEKDRASKRAVRGGSFNDKNPKDFEIASRRPVNQVTHHRWLGFWGVVRLPIE
jgi:serine/threonine-protein kinase